MAKFTQDRRQRRTHQDWFLWKTAWDELLRPIQAALAAEKRAKDSYGRFRHPRRVAALKAQETLLHKLRKRVRRIARAEVERTKAAAKRADAKGVPYRRPEPHGAAPTVPLA